MIRPVLALCLLPIPALAEELDRFFIATHTVVLDATAKGMRLSVDGRVRLETAAITLDLPGDVAGVAVQVGWAQAAEDCPPAPFVLGLPRDGAAWLDGPLETCQTLRADYRDGALRLVPEAGAGGFAWTPGAGFGPVEEP